MPPRPAARALAAIAPVAAAAAALALAGCGGAPPRIAIGPPPAKATTAPLAGPLCAGAACRCMHAPDEAGAPEAGKKRFEIRLGPSPYELWATVPGGVLYKSLERADACFYIDLPPGEHAIELRASNDSGVAAGLAISELGPAAHTAYATLRFSCGGVGGVCSFDELDGKRGEYAAVKGGVHDP